ncbi:hypothetical protein GmHk_10G029893 [Glycine max]|nr:hypothetical protein GmHk_10G029893 [Glycine max]
MTEKLQLVSSLVFVLHQRLKVLIYAVHAAKRMKHALKRVCTLIIRELLGALWRNWETLLLSRVILCCSILWRGLIANYGQPSIFVLKGVAEKINGYPGDCSFGAVPANVKMAHNSMPNKKREHILETLTNSSLLDALYAPNNVLIHLFSPSTQGLTMIEKVTRLYLRKSASISQSILKLNAPETRVASYEADNSSDESSSSSYICCSQVMTMLTPDVTADTWNHSKIEETWYYSIKLLKVLFCLMWEVLAKKLNMMSY